MNAHNFTHAFIMKTTLVLVLFSTLVAVQSAPHHLVTPATRSIYHGVLGTFPVAPVASYQPEVYSPFAQTVLPQSLGYQGYVGYQGYQGYPGYQFQVASPGVTYYTPSYSLPLGGHQFAGVPFLDASYPVPAPVPVAPVTTEVDPSEFSPPQAPQAPQAPQETPETQEPQGPQSTTDEIQTDENQFIQSDVADDDDTVTVDAI